MTPNDRMKALLSDLGKSTLRGIKKCPKCGTYNGTRGICCKNKACDAVFKEAGEKRKNYTEVCKLVTGYSTQIFSVRIRDKGPDYRGFVQLPNLAGNIPYDEALCFVEACQRTFQAHLGCHEKYAPVIPICQHIEAALRCENIAQPLDITEDSIASLSMSTEMKEAVWQLKSESTSPIVQRVSRHIMAVKCESNSKHPLGYLHVSFFLYKTKDCQIQYSCSCPFYKTKSQNRCDVEGFVSLRRCVHYYACVAAIAGDAKLSEELAAVLEAERPAPPPVNHFLSLELLETPGQVIVPEVLDDEELQQEQHIEEVADGAADANEKQLVAIFGDVVDVDNCEVEVEMLPVETSLLQHMLPDDITQMQGLEVVHSLDMCVNEEQLVMEQPAARTVLVNQKSLSQLLATAPPPSALPTPSVLPLPAQRQNDADKYKKCKSKDENSLTVSSEKNAQKILPPYLAKRKRVPNVATKEVYDEHATNMMFLEWLSSVTESINETMHYQCNGSPDPLIFRCPQKFYECLKERISNAGLKKRLPNSTIIVTRNDSPPFGKFTKYTWIINNIIQLKHIFETPQVSLLIARSFIKNSDGSYDVYNASSSYEHFAKTENTPRIKPLEYKTFLKVGYNFKDQTKPSPFIIEWIPDILPMTRTGELKLTFQFGHHSPLTFTRITN